MEKEVLEKFIDDGLSIRQIVKNTDKSYTTVRYWLNKFELKTKKRSKSENVIIWRKKAKIKLVEYKGGECQICGYKRCISALEFHHIDPSEKDFTISGKSWSLERLKNEADKCILVCSNCHKEIHEGIIIL